MKLKNTQLLPNKALIDGQWVADSPKTFKVFNPADGTELAELPEMGLSETQAAIKAANAAAPGWANTPASTRKDILDRWVNLIRDNIDDLAIILTTEQGKPLAQAKSEYENTLEKMSFMAGETLRTHGQTLESIGPDTRNLVIRQPFGVTAGVAPWNFPALTVMSKLCPALAAGNTMVLKPAQDTPLTALAMAYLGQQAGLPNGVLNVVLADNPIEIGNELSTNPIVRKFSFTGSTAVGKLLYAQCASTVKNVALELGGNSPFIIFADADLDAAAKGAASLKFANCGQICVNANRFFVHDDIYDSFMEKFMQHVKAIKVGAGLQPETTMGPMINEKGIRKVEELVANAVSKGAKIEAGGKRLQADSLFYQPTVLTNMTSDMRMYREEIFGPVAPIYRFNNEADVIAMANDTNYGLAAYFYTQNLGCSWRVSTALQAGTVCVNSAGGFGGGPFGGYKESGIGREQGRVSALDAWCEVKSIPIAGLG